MILFRRNNISFAVGSNLEIIGDCHYGGATIRIDTVMYFSEVRMFVKNTLYYVNHTQLLP